MNWHFAQCLIFDSVGRFHVTLSSELVSRDSITSLVFTLRHSSGPLCKLLYPWAQNTWCMRQLVYIENCMGKSPIVKKKCLNNYLIWYKVFKRQVCDPFEVGKLYFKWDGYLHNFSYDRWFSHTILYIHKLSHIPRILRLGSLWTITFVNSHVFWPISAISVESTLKREF